MPGLRTRSAGAKVTEEEYREIEKRAEASGLTVGEWCREVLLTEVERAETPSAETVLAEVLALRMILLNMLAHIGQGRELSTEQMQKLIDRADAERFRRVTELAGGPPLSRFLCPSRYRGCPILCGARFCGLRGAKGGSQR